MLIPGLRATAVSVRDASMAVPAAALERLRAHHDGFHSLGVTPYAVLLNDFTGVLIQADQLGRLTRDKDVDIMHALPALFEVVADDVLVGQVAVCSLCPGAVWRVEVVFVHGIHHVTVGSRFGSGPRVGWRVGHKNESPQRNHGS